jgi:hypothetical protein
MVVTALFVGRIAYRVFVMAQPHTVVTTDWNPGMSDFGGFSSLYHNPWTRLVFFILIGYYVYYYWYVLHESKHLKPEDMEDRTPVTSKSKARPSGNV